MLVSLAASFNPTSMRIVNWPSPHSPLPVHYTNGPDLVAYLALAVAISTLAAVGCQIRIALREVDYVRKDLENSSTQITEFMRRPNLYATFENGARERTFPSGVIAQGINFLFRAVNDGDRVSRGFLLEFLIPVPLLSGFSGTTRKEQVDGRSTECFVIQLKPGGDLYPNNVPTQPFSTALLTLNRLEPGQRHQCLWRLYDEFGKYPKDEFGSLEIVGGPFASGASPPVRLR